MSAACSRLIEWVAVGLVGAVTGCGQVDLRWSEEVQLTDGQVMVVKRTAKGEKLGEIGGSGGWEQTEMSIEIEASPSESEPPVWRSAFVPVLLDYQKQEKTWSVVATFYTCTGWYDLGRPELPYVEYQSRNGGQWEIVPLEQRLIGQKTNLLSDVHSGGEPAFLSLEAKKGRGNNAGAKYREIVAVWHTNC